MIAHNRPTLGPSETAAAVRILSSGWIARGPEVQAFEDEMCAFHGLASGHALAVSSGSAALYLALWAVGSKGRSVAYPVYACDSLPQAIRLANAHPVPVDCFSDTPFIDLQAMPCVQADTIICAGMFGLPCPVPDGSRHRVIADAAQALGATVGGQPFVLSGDVGILSFSATKLITSGGQGGMLLARQRDWIDAARDFCEFDARGDAAPHFNFQMTDLAAAVGRAQLRRLPEFVRRRTEIFERYRAVGLPMIDVEDPGSVPVRYRAVLRHPAPGRFMARLAARGIRAIAPVAPRELGAHASGSFGRARRLAATTVSMPCYPSLSDHELQRVLDACDRWNMTDFADLTGGNRVFLSDL